MKKKIYLKIIFRITLGFEVGNQFTPKKEEGSILVSLVDSPGHLDFNDQVSSALRLTDGALLVVDSVSGISCQTETVLRQAIEERVTPVLFLNKLDRAFLELKKDEEELYQDLFKTVENTNSLIRSFTPEGVEAHQLDPTKGNVGIGSGKMGFGFTLLQFAQIYSTEKNPPEKMVKYLWGDWFFDAQNKKWRNTPSHEGRKLERGFVKFVLRPIYQLCKLTTAAQVEEESWKKIEMIASKLIPAITKKEQQELRSLKSISPGKELFQKTISLVLPAAEPILSMIEKHIPSPLKAQTYRAEMLYTGPKDDPIFQSIKECNQCGPLCVFVTKMVPFNKSFLAYTRILSGTLKEGTKVTVLGPKYNPNHSSPKDLFKNITIKSVKLSLAKDFITVEKANAGNIVCIAGLEKYVDKSCTLFEASYTPESPLYPIKAMNFTVSPVVRVSVSPENISDLPKLKEGLSILSKSSSMVEINFDESTKQFVISGAGELHVEILMKDLQQFSNCKLKISTPVVPFCETVSEKSSVCLAKSANKLNRIYCSAQPISQELLKEMQQGKIEEIMKSDPKQLSKHLVKNHQWSPQDAKKIWVFGPEGSSKPTNILVDQTKSSDYLNEIKDHLISAFYSVCSEGVLAGEPLMGVRFDIQEVKVHTDSSHRGSSQIIPAATRVFRACQLMASPKLVEPIYLASIRLANDTLGSVHQFLGSKRTQFISEEHFSNQVQLNVYLPVLSSFGFDSQLKATTSGKAFPSLNFSHFQTLDSDPFKDSSFSNLLALEIRKRKNMKKEFPLPSELVDKL